MVVTGGDPHGKFSRRIGIASARTLRAAIARGDTVRANRIRDRIRAVLAIYDAIMIERELDCLVRRIRTRERGNA